MREPDVRSWLMTTRVPEASFASGADVDIVDVSVACEDRWRMRRWLEGRPARAEKCAVKVGEALEDDLDAVMPFAPWAIFATCRNGADVQRLGAKLAVREARFGLADGATRIVACVVDAAGLLNAASFAGASPRLAALTLDSGILRDGLSAPRATLAPSLGRGLIILAAAAAAVAAIDGPAVSGALRAEAENALQEGFSGKIATTVEDLAVIAAVFAGSRSQSPREPPVAR